MDIGNTHREPCTCNNGRALQTVYCHCVAGALAKDYDEVVARNMALTRDNKVLRESMNELIRWADNPAMRGFDQLLQQRYNTPGQEPAELGQLFGL